MILLTVSFNPDLNLDFYAAGPNFNWDFSSILYSGQDSLVNSEVNQTPFAYQLFFNNIFLYPNHVANFAQKGLDIDAVPNLQITDRFDYFRTSSSSLKKVGFGANINGLPLHSLIRLKPYLIFLFPTEMLTLLGHII